MGKKWLEEVADDEKYWHEDKNLAEWPAPIVQAYADLRKSVRNANVYETMLRVKDTYEIIIKVPVIMALVCIKDNIRDEQYRNLVQMLFLKPLSMGTWHQAANRLCRKSHGEYVLNTDGRIAGILEETNGLYNKKVSGNVANVVNWRNDSIGHGCLKFEDDEEYQEEIKSLLVNMKAYFSSCTYDSVYFFGKEKMTGSGKCLAENAVYLQVGDMQYDVLPYVLASDETTFFFDSYYSGKRYSKYVDYYSGKTRSPMDDALAALIKEILGDSPDGSINTGLFKTDTEEKFLMKLDEGDIYCKPEWLIAELERSMEKLKSGVILVQMERGTGKSAFAYQLANLYNENPLIDNAIVRTCKIGTQQLRGISDFYSKVNEDFMQIGNERIIPCNGQRIMIGDNSADPARDLINELSEYHETYKNSFWIDQDGYTVLVLDGIDELSENTERILDFIPSDGMEEGTFVIMTSRFEDEDTVGERAKGYISRAKEKARSVIEVRRDQETNKQVLENYVEKKCPKMSDEDKMRLIKASDYRFLKLKVLINIGGEMQNHTEDKVVAEYLNFLEKNYISRQREELYKICMALSVYETFTLNEYVDMLGGDSLSYRLMGVFNDLLPVLTASRDKDGNVYEYANTGYRSAVAKLEKYSDMLQELLAYFQRNLKIYLNDIAHVDINSRFEKNIYSLLNLWETIRGKDKLEKDFWSDGAFEKLVINDIPHIFLGDERFKYGGAGHLKTKYMSYMVEWLISIKKNGIDLCNALKISDYEYSDVADFDITRAVTDEEDYEKLRNFLIKDLKDGKLDEIWIGFLVYDECVYGTYDDACEIVQAFKETGNTETLINYIIAYTGCFAIAYGLLCLDNYRKILLDNPENNEQEEWLLNIEFQLNSGRISSRAGDEEKKRAKECYKKIIEKGYKLYNMVRKPYPPEIEKQIRNDEYILYSNDIEKIMEKDRLEKNEAFVFMHYINEKFDNYYDGKSYHDVASIFQWLNKNLDMYLQNYNEGSENFGEEHIKNYFYLVFNFFMRYGCITDSDEIIDDILRWNLGRWLEALHVCRVVTNRPYRDDTDILERIEALLLNQYADDIDVKGEDIKKAYYYYVGLENFDGFRYTVSYDIFGLMIEMFLDDDAEREKARETFKKSFARFANVPEVYQLSKKELDRVAYYMALGAGEKEIDPAWDTLYKNVCQGCATEYEKKFDYVVGLLDSPEETSVDVPRMIKMLEKCFENEIYSLDKDELKRKIQIIDDKEQKLKERQDEDLNPIIGAVDAALDNARVALGRIIG